MSSLEGVNGTTCDAQQYQQGLLPLTSPNRFMSCLTRGQTIGLAVGPRFLSFKIVSNLAYLPIADGRGVLH